MYRIDDFKRLGLYEEKPEAIECDLDGGKVISSPNIPERMKMILRGQDTTSHAGDYSRQDSALVSSLLNAGYSPKDIYSTFNASPRGRIMRERREGHYEDYLRRTIEKAAGYIEATPDKIDLDFARRKGKVDGSGLVISMGHEVETERVEWLWPGYIPAGKVTVFAGDPGMGKSTITYDIISRISRGTFMPAGERSVTGSSLIASAEDAPEDTIVPRLIAANCNLRKVGIIREVREEVEEGDTRYLSFPRDFELLRAALTNRGCRVLVIDPLNAFIERGTDTYKDQDMRSILHPLSEIAHETGTAIFVVAHLNKKEDGSTLYRVGGSIGFIAAARSVLAVAQLPDDSRVLYSLKSNLGPRPASLAYETRQVRKRKTNGQWLGEDVINSSGIRWLGEVDYNPFSKNGAIVGGVANEEAASFLREVLRQIGEMETDTLYREARQAGISRAALNAVKNQLSIRATKRNGVWVWQWPESTNTRD